MPRRPLRDRTSRARWHVAVLILAALSAVAPAKAQQGGYGSIAGIAGDSVHGSALVGALVTVENLGRNAISDTTGAFRIDSIPPGDWRLVLFHPLLDSLRISLVTSTLTVVADSALNVVIAVPSATTLLALKCGTDTTAVIIGAVSVADETLPPNGGYVELSWIETRIGRGIGIRHTPQSARAAIDDRGMFQLCGVPPDVIGDLVAVSGTDTSATLTVSFLESPLAIVGIVLPGSDVQAVEPPVDPTTLAADPEVEPSRAVLRRGQAVITGTVRTAEGRPVAGARVSVHGAVGAAIADSTGAFTLRDQPSGTGVIVARKLGLPALEEPVTLTTSQANEIHLRMPSDIRVLSEIVVTARRDAELARVGFLSRKQRRPGSYFLGPEDMDRMANRPSLAQVLGDAPNLRYSNGRVMGGRRGVKQIPTDMTISMIGDRCVQYVVDGQVWLGDPPTAWLTPRDIGAVEIYTSDDALADLPLASNVRWLLRGDLQGETCEVVIIWTRSHLRIE